MDAFWRMLMVVAIVVVVIVGGGFAWRELDNRFPPEDQALEQQIKTAKVRRFLESMSTGRSVDLDAAIASARASETPRATTPSTTPTPPAAAKGVARAPASTDCSHRPGTSYVAGRGCVQPLAGADAATATAAAAASNSAVNSCAGRARGSVVIVDVPGPGYVDRVQSTC